MTYENPQLQKICDDLPIKCNKAIDYTKNEYSLLRAGRANSKLLEKVSVNYYGTMTPITQMGNISTPEPRMLVITLWDKSALGAAEKAEELLQTIENSISLRQFENLANPMAHYLSTGKEIYEDMDGQIDYFVAGAGTGGTYTGIMRYLKEQNPHIWGILADPIGSTMGGGEHADMPPDIMKDQFHMPSRSNRSRSSSASCQVLFHPSLFRLTLSSSDTATPSDSSSLRWSPGSSNAPAPDRYPFALTIR